MLRDVGYGRDSAIPKAMENLTSKEELSKHIVSPGSYWLDFCLAILMFIICVIGVIVLSPLIYVWDIGQIIVTIGEPNGADGGKLI